MDTEKTDVGEQNLIPGVAPVTLRERLRLLSALPLSPDKPQKPCDIGLFDDVARAQGDLFYGRRS